ncbi:MAG TPA: prolyl oligopeptidase family serine peptidase [Steroidobacteraceae bacterium]|nr:prolyl oligopeptidase family serine peptidase [Steroidobacteraceae bacterium]
MCAWAGDAPTGEVVWIKANGLRLKTMIYHSAKMSSHPILLVVLHGDLLGVRAIPSSTYHYVFAQEATLKNENLVAAALLRPGYRDNTGERSEGTLGMATGDNYTPEVVDAVAQVIDQLKAKYHPAHTVLAGHSGGAAITGDFLGRWPAGVDAGFMVSCPCDLAAWRRHMQQLQNGNSIWSMPINGLSPMDLAGKVLPTVRVRLMVGSEDPVAPAAMSKHYADVLRSHGDDVTLTILPGLEHEILLEPATYDALTELLRTLAKHD